MSPLRTPVLDRLGIELPIVQAPIGSAATPELAAAVSEAGGLGSLALSWTDVAELRRRLQRTSALTRRPYAANLVLEWDQRERLAACLDEHVPVISTFWGDPSAYTQTIHAGGATHVHTVASVSEAQAAAAAGVDVIVAQGWEAGGHVRGSVATLALVPAVVDAVDPVPVLAAGGITDGRGIAAALMLGAQGAWIGTAFLLSQEADVHERYRDELLRGGAADTIYSGAFDQGWPDAPHRVLRNSTLERWIAAGSPAAPDRPGEGEIVAHSGADLPIRRYAFRLPTRETTGDVEAMALYAGQGIGLGTRVLPAADLVRRLAAEATAALNRATD